MLASPGWHPGVIGICASRLLERYYKPAILIACDEAKGIGKGSARSNESFHLYEGLKACRHVLEHYGGHHCAAGLAIQLDKLDAFRALFDAVVAESPAAAAYIPSLLIDAEVRLPVIQRAGRWSRVLPAHIANPR